MAESELDKQTVLVTELTRKVDELQVRADEATRLKDQLDECVSCTWRNAHQYCPTDVEIQVSTCGRQVTEDGERHGEVQEEAARGS